MTNPDPHKADPNAFSRGLGFALVAVLFWGSQLPIAKTAMGDIDGFFISALRYGIAAVILVPVLAWRGGTLAGWQAADRNGVLLSGVIGMGLSPLFVFVGLSLTVPEHAAILIALQPTMTALAHWKLGGPQKRPPTFTLVCVAVAFIGVVLVVTKGKPLSALGAQQLAGNLMVVFGAFLWVVYTIRSERYRAWPTLRFTTFAVVAGFAVATVGSLLAAAVGLAHVPAASSYLVYWPQLLFLGLGGVLLAMLCWTVGVKRIGSLNGMLLLNLVPVIAFAVRYAQGHRFEAIELAGTALVICALAASNLVERRRVAQRAKVLAQADKAGATA
jgi:drug/metabolite transporter (DMT)-like permease